MQKGGDIMKKTTIKKLINNKCYCIRQDKDIKITECTLFNCGRWKKCMKKTNNDVDKELGKNVKAS